MTKTFDELAGEDVIDSRDVIARLDELQAERDDLESNVLNFESDVEDVRDIPGAEKVHPEEKADREERLSDAKKELAEWDAEYAEELRALKDLAEEASGIISDWEHGETLVKDSYFQEYAQQLAEDCDMIPKNLSWPCNCIDWEQAARELKHDYSSVTIGGDEYWGRSG